MGTQAATKARINFVDGISEPVFSNWDASRVRMDLVPVMAEMIDIRGRDVPPSMAREGFTLARHAVAGDWGDQSWVDAVYVPSCLELVKGLTGARDAIQMFFPLIRTTGLVEEGLAYPGNFLHLDIPREEYRGYAQLAARDAGLELEGRRAAIFNVWKAITPPPQAMPLALCRRGDLGDADHVVGFNNEDDHPSHFVAVKAPDRPIAMHYVPDIRLDESLVFISADFDPANSLGCAHQAIVPEGSSGLVPRTSIEVRVLCVF